MRHALSNGLNVYETNYVMTPFTSSLAYHTLTPFWYPVWALIEPLAGTVAAMTGIFVLAFTLSGYIFYLLLRDEGVPVGLALIGGAMLALSPMMFLGVFWTNINLMNWFWLPALILVWRRVAKANLSKSYNALTWAVLCGFVLWAMLLSGLQYALFAAFLIVPYGLWTLWVSNPSATRIRLALYGGVALGVALILLWFAGPLPYILDYEVSRLALTPFDDTHHIPFPQGYFWHLGEGGSDMSIGGVVLPLTLVAVGYNLWRRRTGKANDPAPVQHNFVPVRWFWLFVAVPPLVLMAGTQFPFFYATLHGLLGGMFRYPERFAAVALIPAVLFTFRSLSPLFAVKDNKRLVALTALMLFVIADSRMLFPMHIQPQPVEYDFYQEMNTEPYEYVVLEVPTGASSGEGIVGEPEYSELQFYGTVHGKRMVNGHLSRVPINHFWYMRTDDPLFAWLGQRRYLEPELVESGLAQVIDDYPVGYVVVHTDLIERFTSAYTVGEVIGYLNSLSHLLCPPIIEGDALAYRTAWHPDGCGGRTPPQTEPGVYRIDMGDPSDAAFIGWGWHSREEIVPGLTARWTGAPHATDPDAAEAFLYVDLPPGAYEMVASMQAFQEAHEVRVQVNGQTIGTVSVPAGGLTEATLTIPADMIGDGQHIMLNLAYDTPRTPAGSDRSLALLVDWIEWRRVGE